MKPSGTTSYVKLDNNNIISVFDNDDDSNNIINFVDNDDNNNINKKNTTIDTTESTYLHEEKQSIQRKHRLHPPPIIGCRQEIRQPYRGRHIRDNVPWEKQQHPSVQCWRKRQP